jgi:hypothetical protein
MIKERFAQQSRVRKSKRNFTEFEGGRMQRLKLKAYLIFTLILGVFILPGCGDGGNGHWDKPSDSIRLVSVVVTPAEATIPTDGFQPFTATATYSDGSTLDVTTSSVWSSNNPGVAIISPTTGVAEGIAAGSGVAITATFGGMTATTALLTVTGATLTSIVVTPELATIAANGIQQFTATANYSDASTLNVTAAPGTVWTAANVPVGGAAVATLSANGVPGAGRATGVVAGTAEITATYRTLTDTATLTVTAAAIIPGAVCSADTDPTIPTATLSDPTSGNQFATTSTSGVAGNGKIITVTFDMAMDPTTINATTFTLAPEGGTVLIPASVTYDALTNVATLTTSSALLENTVYEVIITTDVTSAATPGVSIVCPYAWNFRTIIPAVTGQMPVPLGSASNFVILASAAITNIPTSAITGDVGLTPDSGSNISGFDQPLTCPEVTGTVYAVDAAGPACAVIDPVLIQNAKNDAEIAFLNARAAVRGTPTSISGDLNGLTFAPGLYESLTSLEISPGGFLFLDAKGDVNAVFIIRSETTITTQSTSQVILAGGAKANNVYWTAGSSVTLGTNSIMKGTLIAGTSISLLTGANLEGRALNQGAAAESITLDQATITLPLP